MSDEISAAFAQLQSKLSAATVDGARGLGREVSKGVRKRVRRDRPVSIQDVISGKEDPVQKVVYREVPQGADITVNPSYVRMKGDLRAVVATVDPDALLREGLQVKDKAGKQRYQSFTAPKGRLASWAASHNQVNRRCIWTGDPIIAKAAIVEPILSGIQADKILSQFLK